VFHYVDFIANLTLFPFRVMSTAYAFRAATLVCCAVLLGNRYLGQEVVPFKFTFPPIIWFFSVYLTPKLLTKFTKYMFGFERKTGYRNRPVPNSNNHDKSALSMEQHQQHGSQHQHPNVVLQCSAMSQGFMQRAASHTGLVNATGSTPSVSGNNNINVDKDDSNALPWPVNTPGQLQVSAVPADWSILAVVLYMMSAQV
jgi:hypothetical protein